MTEMHKEAVEATAASAVEKTRNLPVYMPNVDIFEAQDSVVVVADMPGVDESTVNITLENEVLKIEGRVEDSHTKSQRLVYREYGEGHYERSFALSDQVDRKAIKATVKNGVLRIVLPKAEELKPRKIAVTAA